MSSRIEVITQNRRFLEVAHSVDVKNRAISCWLMASQDLIVPTATCASIANLIAQAKQSLGFIVSAHVARIHEHAGASTFDYALANTDAIFATFRDRYAAYGANR